jgi:2'-hydroxyisoflavone reductase
MAVANQSSSRFFWNKSPVMASNIRACSSSRERKSTMLSRRELLKLGLYALAATRVPAFAQTSSPPKKILILGGTGFLGPSIVERALDRGHIVTLFNRGQTGADFFPNVEKIHGDRQPADKGNLLGLQGDRKWDAVIDVWANDPEVVMPVAKLLVDRTRYYFFVSSIGAYADYSKIGIEESAPTRLDRPGYGGNKARSEKGLQDLFTDRVGIVRPCAITGPRDDSLSYHFWLSHLLKEEETIGPGTGDDAYVEYVDVRDVARWIIDSVEQERSGIYNVCSLATPFRVFLEESARGIGGKAKIVWVDGDFLRNEQHLRTFDQLPYWTPDRPGFEQISSTKARACGFSTRPLSETAKDAWTWYQKTVPPDLVYPQKQYSYEWGISLEREREILAAWKQKRTSGA